jgi:drug/metabolite transporter (DMT)-like permease
MAYDSPATGIIFAALLGSLATTAVQPFVFVLPKSLGDLAMLVSLGCLGGLGHFLVIKAFQAAPASVIAPLGYVELLGTATLGYLIFANFPDALTWIGAVIIIASGLYIAMRERKRAGIL